MIKIIESLSDNYVILDSGSIITFSCNSSTTFLIRINQSANLNDVSEVKVVIKFEEDGTKEKKLKKDFDEDSNCIFITCTNFNNNFGSGTVEAVKLFSYSGKAVYINFWVFLLGATQLKRIDYCFYMER